MLEKNIVGTLKEAHRVNDWSVTLVVTNFVQYFTKSIN